MISGHRARTKSKRGPGGQWVSGRYGRQAKRSIDQSIALLCPNLRRFGVCYRHERHLDRLSRAAAAAEEIAAVLAEGGTTTSDVSALEGATGSEFISDTDAAMQHVAFWDECPFLHSKVQLQSRQSLVDALVDFFAVGEHHDLDIWQPVTREVIPEEEDDDVNEGATVSRGGKGQPHATTAKKSRGGHINEEDDDEEEVELETGFQKIKVPSVIVRKDGVIYADDLSNIFGAYVTALTAQQQEEEKKGHAGKTLPKSILAPKTETVAEEEQEGRTTKKVAQSVANVDQLCQRRLQQNAERKAKRGHQQPFMVASAAPPPAPTTAAVCTPGEINLESISFATAFITALVRLTSQYGIPIHTISLSKNNISSMDTLFNALQSVKWSAERLIPQLRVLDLSCNDLQNLSGCLFRMRSMLPGLIKLSMRENPVTRKPDYVEQVRKTLIQVQMLDGEYLRKPPLALPHPKASPQWFLKLGDEDIASVQGRRSGDASFYIEPPHLKRLEPFPTVRLATAALPPQFHLCFASPAEFHRVSTFLQQYFDAVERLEHFYGPPHKPFDFDDEGEYFAETYFHPNVTVSMTLTENCNLFSIRTSLNSVITTTKTLKPATSTMEEKIITETTSAIDTLQGISSVDMKAYRLHAVACGSASRNVLTAGQAAIGKVARGPRLAAEWMRTVMYPEGLKAEHHLGHTSTSSVMILSRWLSPNATTTSTSASSKASTTKATAMGAPGSGSDAFQDASRRQNSTSPRGIEIGLSVTLEDEDAKKKAALAKKKKEQAKAGVEVEEEVDPDAKFAVKVLKPVAKELLKPSASFAGIYDKPKPAKAEKAGKKKKGDKDEEVVLPPANVIPVPKIGDAVASTSFTASIFQRPVLSASLTAVDAVPFPIAAAGDDCPFRQLSGEKDITPEAFQKRMSKRQASVGAAPIIATDTLGRSYEVLEEATYFLTLHGVMSWRAPTVRGDDAQCVAFDRTLTVVGRRIRRNDIEVPAEVAAAAAEGTWRFGVLNDQIVLRSPPKREDKDDKISASNASTPPVNQPWKTAVIPDVVVQATAITKTEDVSRRNFEGVQLKLAVSGGSASASTNSKLMSTNNSVVVEASTVPAGFWESPLFAPRTEAFVQRAAFLYGLEPEEVVYCCERTTSDLALHRTLTALSEAKEEARLKEVAALADSAASDGRAPSSKGKLVGTGKRPREETAVPKRTDSTTADDEEAFGLLMRQTSNKENSSTVQF